MGATLTPEVVVDHDPATWLRGPDGDSTPEQREEWRTAAVEAYARAYDLTSTDAGPQQRAYLERLLGAFGAWDPPAQMTFLRLRHLGDEAVPAGLEFYDRQQLADIATQFPDSNFVLELLTAPRERELVGETSLEEVEGATAWRRLFYSVRGSDQVVHSFVRYVRRFERSGVVCVLRFGGDSPAQAVGMIADADALVASISIEGER